MLLDQLRDIVIPIGPKRHAGERTGDRDTRRERRVLVDRQRLVVAGYGHHIEGSWGRHRAFRPQVVEVRVWVRNKGFVGEEIHSLEVGHEALLLDGSKSTGSDVGERNT